MNPGHGDGLRMIVGMSRAGTTSMVAALNMRGDTAAFGESGFWGTVKAGMLDAAELDSLRARFKRTRYTTLDEDRGELGVEQDRLQSAIESEISGLEAPARPVDVYRAIGRGAARASGRPFWVEKTPHHLRYVDRIIAEDPGARILVMIRSPAAFLRSYKHQGDRKPDATRRKFHSLYHPAIAALICRGYLAAALRAKARYPDNIMLLKHESLLQRPEPVLGRVAEHLRLPADIPMRFPRTNSSFSGRAGTPELAKADRIWLYWIAGRKARQANYGIRPISPLSARFALSCGSLLIWPVRNFFLLQRLPAGPLTLARRWLTR